MKFKVGLILAALTFFVALYFVFDLQFVQRQWSHAKSNLVGLNRVITIYTYDGKTIKTYSTKSQIERPGDGTQSFFLDSGKRIDVMGRIVISEEQ